MCAAIFSVSGDGFHPDDFLATSSLSKSAETWLADGKIKPGFQIVVSEKEELGVQIDGVIRFVGKFSAELKRLKTFVGVEHFEFRLAYFWPAGAAALTYELPVGLHVALAEVKATLTVCVYPCSGE
jgi:hypothetical protein